MAAKATRTTVTREELPEGGDTTEEKQKFKEAPVFAGMDLDEDEVVDHIVIYRTKPIAEGNLGKLDASVDEDEIREQFGGGTFRLIGRNASNRPITGAFRTVDLAGDPIFTNDLARKKWEKMQGIAPEKPAAPVADRPMGFGEIMAMISTQTAHARSEMMTMLAQREAAAEAAHKREMQLVEMRAKADREAAAEREVARQEAAAAEAERNRQFMATMVQLVKADADKNTKESPVQMLLSGMEIAAKMQGSGEFGDPVTALIARLPETIAEARETAKDIVAGTGSSKSNGARKLAKDELLLKGEIAKKTQRAAALLQKQGKDPEAVFSRVMDAIAKSKAPASAAAAKKNGTASKPAYIPPKKKTAAKPEAKA